MDEQVSSPASIAHPFPQKALLVVAGALSTCVVIFLAFVTNNSFFDTSTVETWDASNTALHARVDDGTTAWYRGTTDGSFERQPLFSDGTMVDIASANGRTYVIAHDDMEYVLYELVEGMYVRRAKLPEGAHALTLAQDASALGYIAFTEGTPSAYVLIEGRDEPVLLGEGSRVGFSRHADELTAFVVRGSGVDAYTYDGKAWASGVRYVETSEPLRADITVGPSSSFAVSGASGTIYRSVVSVSGEIALEPVGQIPHHGLFFVESTLYAFLLTPSPSSALPLLSIAPADGSSAFMPLHVPPLADQPLAFDRLD